MGSKSTSIEWHNHSNRCKEWLCHSNSSIRTLRGARFAIRVVWQLYITVLQRSIYTVVTYCTRSIYVRAYSSTRCSSDLHHVFTAQFLYSKIIVQIRIKTPVFAHIIVDAISPHLNLRFWGWRVDTCWDTCHSRHSLMLILGHQFVFVCPGLSLVNDCLLRSQWVILTPNPRSLIFCDFSTWWFFYSYWEVFSLIHKTVKELLCICRWALWQCHVTYDRIGIDKHMQLHLLGPHHILKLATLHFPLLLLAVFNTREY